MADDIPPWLPRAFGLFGRLAPGLAARAAAELLTRPRGRNAPQPWELENPVVAPRAVQLHHGLWALAWGEGGPTVLAQHGWRGRPGQFGPLAAALVARGYSFIALDAPGHGRSHGKRATPRLLADSILAAASSLPPLHAVVGHSLGGAGAAISIELGLATGRLVVLASPSRPSRFISDYAARIGLPMPARRDLERWFDAHAGRPAAQLDPVALRFADSLRVLVVHDRHDDVIPVSEAELLEEAWPHAQFHYTTGLGHRELLADPSVIGSIAEFVDL
jgi:pimeloyl-ACP methyl ester carboxylesterase